MKISTFHINMSMDIAIVLVLFLQPFLGETVSQLAFWYSGINLSIPSSAHSLRHI